MIFISLIIVLYIGFVLLYRWLYINELAISFMPYILVFCILYSLILLIIWITKWFKKKVYILFLLVFISFSIGLWIEYKEFYNNTPLAKANIDNQDNIQIMYWNVFYLNNQFEEFIESIDVENTDVLAFVEFTAEHMEIFEKKWLLEEYPYDNIVSWSKNVYWTVFENVVFSKYPLVNTDAETQTWSRRYSYVGIDVWDEIIYMYVVHTASPYAYEFFVSRNKHLEKLANNIQENTKLIWDNPNIIIVWDFNVSPWSSYYKTFEKEINNLAKNISEYQFSIFTWNVLFMFTHIDHVFVSDEVKVNNINIVDIKWSDHKGFLFEVEV